MSEEQSKNLEVASGSTPPGAFKVPNVPKVSYADPTSIATTYAWGTNVEFSLPKTIGKVIDMVLQVDITVATADVALPPTPYWFESIITSLGGSQAIETVWKDECFQETLAFLDIQDFQTIAPMVNIGADGSWNKDETKASEKVAVGTKRFFLPLWANCLMTAQPYLKGFNSDWRLKFLLSTTAPILGGSGTVTVNALRILITEAQLPPSIEAKLARQHMGQVTYNTINRLRHTDAKMPSASGVAEYVTTTLCNESAGILTYIRANDNSANYSKLGQRCPVSNINLRDAQGNPYYSTDLDGNFNLYFLSPWSVKGEPLAGNQGKYNYLLPFSSHVGAVLQDGRDLGAYACSGREKVCLTFSSGDITALTANCGTNPLFVAVSYDYMRIKVKNGNARVYYSRE